MDDTNSDDKQGVLVTRDKTCTVVVVIIKELFEFRARPEDLMGTRASICITVFWHVTPCSLVHTCQILKDRVVSMFTTHDDISEQTEIFTTELDIFLPLLLYCNLVLVIRCSNPFEFKAYRCTIRAGIVQLV